VGSNYLIDHHVGRGDYGMAIQITRWKPDTCDCTIEYEWDDTVPPESRTHTFNNLVDKCSAHSALGDSSVWSALIDENPRKNKTVAIIYDLLSTQNKKNAFLAAFTFDFDANRVLLLHSNGSLTQQEKNNAQNALNTQFGTGKVVVD